MHILYPAIKPYKMEQLKVTEPHTLYIEETGNPDGIPVIVLHPGPGAEINSHFRRYFDPRHYRIILFDQRGCGRSTPHAELKNNTTQELIEDIESIREHLKLKHFVLFGGGWGALLALLYSEKYPQNVSALLLHQIYLGRQKDIHWFYQSGANLIYPDYWQEFTRIVPEGKQDNIPQYYADCLQSDNELARMAAAKHWAIWQAHCSSIHPHASILDQFSEPHFALALSTIESHYVCNNYFIEENQVLNNAHKIRHIPTYLVHGRYDMVCPLAGAWALQQAIPASNLTIIRDASHSDQEPGIIDAIVSAAIEICKHRLDVG